MEKEKEELKKELDGKMGKRVVKMTKDEAFFAATAEAWHSQPGSAAGEKETTKAPPIPRRKRWKGATAQECEERIRAKLKELGRYSPEMDFSIELCAGTYMLYSVARHDVEKLVSTSLNERTRENHIRKLTHPAVTLLPALAEALRKQLGDLGLAGAVLSEATRPAAPAEDDPLERLVAAVRSVGSNGKEAADD